MLPVQVSFSAGREQVLYNTIQCSKQKMVLSCVYPVCRYDTVRRELTWWS